MSTVIISLLIKMYVLESRACDIINIESAPSEFKIRRRNLGVILGKINTDNMSVLHYVGLF